MKAYKGDLSCMGAYLTVRDVAQRLEVKEETVRRWLRKGLLHGTPLGRAGYRIEPVALETFLRLRNGSAAPSPQKAIIPSEARPDTAKWHGLEMLADGFFVLDQRWHIVFINNVALRMLGKTSTDLLGRNFWFLFDFLQDTSLSHTFYTVAQKGRTEACDEAALIPGRWLHLRVQPVADGVAVQLIDITERKQAELQERRLAQIVQYSDTVIFSVTFSGIITSWNRGAELFYGYQAEEMLGQSIASIVLPEFRAEQLHILAHIHEDNHYDILEATHIHKSGRALPVSLRLSPLPNMQNKPTGVIVVSHDLSLWRESNASLSSHEEQRYQLMEKYLRYGIWVSDAQGRLEYVSQSFLNLVKMTLHDCRHHGWFHLVPPNEVPSIQAAWQRCRDRGELWTLIYHLRAHDGCDHTILTRGQPVRDPQGTIIRWIGIHINIDDPISIQNAVTSHSSG